MRKSLLVILAFLTPPGAGMAQANVAMRVPAPTVDIPARNGLRIAILAGGCFWDLTGVFEHVRGVRSVTSGYAGGSRETATYDQVMTERTRHAEAVRIVYDPGKVSYGTLLRIFFSVAHDPTSFNLQGALRGPAYRSAIFPLDKGQRHVAAAYIAQIDRAHTFARPIVTRIDNGAFFPAEGYHQNYCGKHPQDPYVISSVKPKVAALRSIFPKLAL